MDVHAKKINLYFKECIGGVEDSIVYVVKDGQNEPVSFKKWLTHILVGPFSDLIIRLDYINLKIKRNMHLDEEDLKILDDLNVNFQTAFTFLKALALKRSKIYEMPAHEGNIKNPVPYPKLNRIFYYRLFIVSENKDKNIAIIQEYCAKISSELIELEKEISKIFL